MTLSEVCLAIMTLSNKGDKNPHRTLGQHGQ
jgi:hypothetical protein